MRKTKNIFFIIVMIILIINIFNVNTSLSACTSLKILESSDNIKIAAINPSDYDPGTITASDADGILDKVGFILGAIRNISAVVAVIILMIIGLKYIFGSVEEKANYKATMIPYIIGCVMAVAGTTLVDFIYKTLN